MSIVASRQAKSFGHWAKKKTADHFVSKDLWKKKIDDHAVPYNYITLTLFKQNIYLCAPVISIQYADIG